MSSAIAETDHQTIRRWAEENGARPSRIKGTGGGEDPGMLRLDFDEEHDQLQEITWDEWFDAFERNQLAILLSEETRFNKIVSRER